MMPTRWLVVGGGNMGLRHISYIHHLYPTAKIILLTSHNKNLSPNYTLANTFEEVLSFKPQCAIICNAAPYHCEIAARLIREGIHCLIEKPLSDQYAKAYELKKIADNFPNVVVLVGYQLRYKPGLSHLHKILEKREMGKTYFARASIGHYLPDWRLQNYQNSVSAQRILGGGVLLEQSHEFDYIKYLFGEPQHITCVSQKVSNLELDVEDLAITIFQYSSGLIISIHQDMLSFPPHRKLEIAAEKGSIYWDLRNDIVELTYLDKNIPCKRFESDFKRSEQLYLAEITHFIDCINQKAIPKVNLEDACITLQMIDDAVSFSQNNNQKNKLSSL